jgi:3'-phosphoadenosine 5'-phosphosulfate sulfotransferase (PAPS reductase)/FAD synthetase
MNDYLKKCKHIKMHGDKVEIGNQIIPISELTNDIIDEYISKNQLKYDP